MTAEFIRSQAQPAAVYRPRITVIRDGKEIGVITRYSMMEINLSLHEAPESTIELVDYSPSFFREDDVLQVGHRATDFDGADYLIGYFAVKISERAKSSTGESLTKITMVPRTGILRKVAVPDTLKRYADYRSKFTVADIFGIIKEQFSEAYTSEKLMMSAVNLPTDLSLSGIFTANSKNFLDLLSAVCDLSASTYRLTPRGYRLNVEVGRFGLDPVYQIKIGNGLPSGYTIYASQLSYTRDYHDVFGSVIAQGGNYDSPLTDKNDPLEMGITKEKWLAAVPAGWSISSFKSRIANEEKTYYKLSKEGASGYSSKISIGGIAPFHYEKQKPSVDEIKLAAQTLTDMARLWLEQRLEPEEVIELDCPVILIHLKPGDLVYVTDKDFGTRKPYVTKIKLSWDKDEVKSTITTSNTLRSVIDPTTRVFGGVSKGQQPPSPDGGGSAGNAPSSGEGEEGEGGRQGAVTGVAAAIIDIIDDIVAAVDAATGNGGGDTGPVHPGREEGETDERDPNTRDSGDLGRGG
jgi:hypothetical protein